jgi:alkylated DNA repair dioxygenase AlkB
MDDLLGRIMPLCGLPSAQECPNSYNLNMYLGGDMSVGWHADDESIFGGICEETSIISLSLGAGRSFEVRALGGRRIHSITLNDGDLMSMEGFFQKANPAPRAEGGHMRRCAHQLDMAMVGPPRRIVCQGFLHDVGLDMPVG